MIYELLAINAYLLVASALIIINAIVIIINHTNHNKNNYDDEIFIEMKNIY